MKTYMGWITRTQYVDLDTGELINWETNKEHYTIITKNANIETNYNRTRGIKTITKICRRRDRIQQTIW